MDFEKLAFEGILALLTLAGTWGVIRAQVADLRLAVKEQDEAIRGKDGLESRVTRLEADHESHTSRLNEAVKKLEAVASDLQRLMLDIARGGK